MKLRLKYESETNADTGEVTPDVISWACEGYRVIPYLELDGGLCPAGYISSIEGCKAFQILPPMAICPENSQPSYIGSNFALFQRVAMTCEINRYTKGRIWCPKGFNVIFPPEALEKYEFGEEISEKETYKIMSNTYNENDQISDEIVNDIFASLNEFSEFNTSKNFPIGLNLTDPKQHDTITSNLFTSSSHYVKESQANIVLDEMRGMGIERNDSLSFKAPTSSKNSKSCLGNNILCGDSKRATRDGDNSQDGKRWERIESSSGINLRKLQEMAMGGALETQMFEPGLQKELRYGPLSGVYVGNYGNAYGKETEQEILISGNLGQTMGNDQVTTAPLLEYTNIGREVSKEPACSLVVAVHSSNCTPLQCTSPFLKEINHILRDWAVQVLQADPDSGSNLIPNGKDLPFTNPG
ncbi:hypothetical protein HWI79_52 [Cryptosporidium felis]|nr:hypothetical protein HWI79_52 [Cryptosporidium felis]